MRRHSVKKYFTLLEVMVSMGVFCVLMLALMQFFTAAQEVWEKTGSRTELHDSARLLNQMLKNDLTSAFYGDDDLDMSNFRFFQYTAGDSTTTAHLTFAAQRTDGLTAVNYRWNPSNLKLYLLEHNETANWANSHWVTDASNSWISSLEGETVQDSNAILENVIIFNVQAQNWEWNSNHVKTSLFNETRWNDQKRPPALVIVSYALLSQNAYEKISNIMKTREVFTDSDTDDAKATKINAALLSHTTALLDGKRTFNHEKITVASDGRQTQERQLIYDNTQFFNIVVPIER